jgi:3-isopropylmalate/(R)-2-methylmalate dehydratase small subunit
MDKFARLLGIAAPLPMINVDTDMIIPKQFLKTIKRTGLGRNLFYDLRFGPDGSEIASFVLNQPGFRKAAILIAGDNFGCGSSREHAPWALLDFGIRCVIAPSFADIFFTNCLKNGILPVVLPKAAVDGLMAQTHGANAMFTVDLPAQTVSGPDGVVHRFEIDPSHKRCLIEGLDDISLTLEKRAAIDGFEARQRGDQPWLYGRGA